MLASGLSTFAAGQLVEFSAKICSSLQYMISAAIGSGLGGYSLQLGDQMTHSLQDLVSGQNKN